MKESVDANKFPSARKSPPAVVISQAENANVAPVMMEVDPTNTACVSARFIVADDTRATRPWMVPVAEVRIKPPPVMPETAPVHVRTIVEATPSSSSNAPEDRSKPVEVIVMETFVAVPRVAKPTEVTEEDMIDRTTCCAPCKETTAPDEMDMSLDEMDSTLDDPEMVPARSITGELVSNTQLINDTFIVVVTSPLAAMKPPEDDVALNVEATMLTVPASASMCTTDPPDAVPSKVLPVNENVNDVIAPATCKTDAPVVLVMVTRFQSRTMLCVVPPARGRVTMPLTPPHDKMTDKALNGPDAVPPSATQLPLEERVVSTWEWTRNVARPSMLKTLAPFRMLVLVRRLRPDAVPRCRIASLALVAELPSIVMVLPEVTS